ncbi:hypothetical protein [Stieleria varia]|uniref:Cytochrome c domain-containing protein n=1 Tax=Stieleria varia TaxID=2528005 RepID=A0A5C6A5D3_9BACT|nr:hypothetical protein [Stieleria varia]TWT94646.1 hypothetical protein Pla52n_54670 [Stieleria varia]
MKRFAILLGCVCFFVSPAMAISEFGKQWKNDYLSGDDVSDEFKSAGRKAGCYVCHVKDHPKKKEARNEYGQALHKYLKKEDFTKEYMKEHPEEAKAKMVEAFKKVNAEHKSKDGTLFGEKIKAGKLPAVDMEYKE